eukprot:GFUD01124175.1.p1 GENE.GFUD01124175.1~~GFUD01124175.1.p1  ORF type:complete len:490 (+),score=96.58 GFUD01124175.1:36-1505(+)
MIKSSISLLPELSVLQQSGVLTDTELVGQDGRVLVHWAVLARFTFWRGLRGEEERGPVTIIMPGIREKELRDLVEMAYGEEKGKHAIMEEKVESAIYDEVTEFKIELDSISDCEDDNNLDEMFEDAEQSAIDKFTKDVPDYIVVDRDAIAKAFSYIESTPVGEKHKTGPWAGREKYLHACRFVDSKGVECGFKEGVGVRYLMRHTQGHVTDIYWCTLCKKSYKRLMGHIKAKHSDRSQEKPLEVRLEESDLSCPECQRKFLTQSSLTYHVNRIHENNLEFNCSECDYRSMTKHQLKNHIRVKHLKSDMWPCHICGKELADKKHMDDHVLLHGEASFSCNFCQLKFKTDKSMNLHKKTKHTEKTLVCEDCGKKFALKSQHDRHYVSMHTNIRNFACDQCDAKCSSKPNLKRHKRIHSEDKPYGCQDCGKSFKQDDALYRHKLVHSGEKPYGCSHCNFRCQQSYDLTKHYKKVHDMIVKNPKEVNVPNTTA